MRIASNEDILMGQRALYLYRYICIYIKDKHTHVHRHTGIHVERTHSPSCDHRPDVRSEFVTSDVGRPFDGWKHHHRQTECHDDNVARDTGDAATTHRVCYIVYHWDCIKMRRDRREGGREIELNEVNSLTSLTDSLIHFRCRAVSKRLCFGFDVGWFV